MLDVKRLGEGPPIVFVPGTIVGAETTWRRQLPLAERWTLVIADRPGFGDTPPLERGDFELEAPFFAELRRKESDRIATVAATLNAVGGSVEPTEDGMVVEGTGGLRGGRVDSHGDHRIAMLAATAGLASAEGLEVGGMDASAVSYPSFAADLESLCST